MVDIEQTQNAYAGSAEIIYGIKYAFMRSFSNITAYAHMKRYKIFMHDDFRSSC